MIFSRLIKSSTLAWLPPMLLITTIITMHFLFVQYSGYIQSLTRWDPRIYEFEKSTYLILMAIGEYWLCLRLVSKVTRYFKNNLFIQKHHNLAVILPFFSSLIKAISLLIIFNVLTQALDLPANIFYFFNKSSSVLIICAIGWLLLKLIDVSEQLLLHHFVSKVEANIERKVLTQTRILKRVAYSIVTVLTAGSILVLFDNVRALGTSVLTSAGVVGLILTFTAQRSLASIFSGLEIALSQPIKIGDNVIIDNEFGTIEEINFRNVVVKLWDWRRLLVPTSYFLEKNFQNWNRVQNSNLIGTVLLYVDFTFPIEKGRKKLEQILNSTANWDKNVGLLQVGDLQERVMQIKILASSHNADTLSNLRAYIREQMIEYIVKNHQYALPKTRSFTIKNDYNSEIDSINHARDNISVT